MRYIIDRFEENFAICEDENKSLRPIPLTELPPGIKEGDILLETDGSFVISPSDTSERRNMMREKLKKLFQ